MVRISDMVLSVLALLCLSPLFLVVAVMLRFTGEGEVFYMQRRVGKAGKVFRLIKFATMLKNSPNIGTGTLTVKNDPRVLPLGRFLRKTKINELPQIWNVLVGDMSLVGPRPMTKEMFALYPDNIKSVLARSLPGLSGIGSLVFRNEEDLVKAHHDPKAYYADYIAPYKGQLEVWYAGKRGFSLYLKVIILTILVVFLPSMKLLWKVLPDLPMPDEPLRTDLKMEQI